MATLVLITSVVKKALEYMLCIYYFVQYYNVEIRALLDNNIKVIAMSLGYIEKYSLKIWKTNAKIQKIDGFILEIFGIIIGDF